MVDTNNHYFNTLTDTISNRYNPLSIRMFTKLFDSESTIKPTRIMSIILDSN